MKMEDMILSEMIYIRRWIAMSSVTLIVLAGSLILPDRLLGGTVAYWRFEPGAFTNDSSGNGFTLLNTGAVSTNSVGSAVPNNNGSAYFNGVNSFMNTIASVPLSSYSGLTIEWWMKSQQDATSGDANIVWEQSDDFNAHPGALAIFINDGYPPILPNDFRISGGQSTAEGGFQKWDRYDTNGWHHYAVTYDTNSGGTRLHFYKDLVEFGSFADTNTGAAQSFTNDLFYFGARAGSGLYFNGMIDEMRISDSVLNTTQMLPEPGVLVFLGSGILLALQRRNRGFSLRGKDQAS